MFSLFKAEWDVVWTRCFHVSFSFLSIENHQIQVEVTLMHEPREMSLVPTLFDSDKKSLVRFRETWGPAVQGDPNLTLVHICCLGHSFGQWA